MKMVPSHQWLNSAPGETGHYADAGKATELQLLDTIEERFYSTNFPNSQGILLPIVDNGRRRVTMNGQGREHVAIVESLGLPIPNRIYKGIVEVLRLLTLTKLNPSPTKDMGLGRRRKKA